MSNSVDSNLWAKHLPNKRAIKQKQLVWTAWSILIISMIGLIAFVMQVNFFVYLLGGLSGMYCGVAVTVLTMNNWG